MDPVYTVWIIAVDCCEHLSCRQGKPEGGAIELMRSTDDEKGQQLNNVELFRDAFKATAQPEFNNLQQVTRDRKNAF